MHIDNDNITGFNIKVNEMGFGKNISDEESIGYSLYIDFGSIVEKFSEYFNDFMEREADEPESDEHLEGVFLKIKEAGFPELKKILKTDNELFCQLVKEELSSEFLGYTLNSKKVLEDNSLFVIQSLNNVEVREQQIFCEGVGYQLNYRLNKTRGCK